MPAKPAIPEACPYCAPPYAGFTDDHVFSRFLGGRRTIRVCKKCNSTFGHSFEAEVSRQAARQQVFISHFGIDLTRNPAVWPSALTVDGKQFDLMPGPEGTQYHLSKPIIYRDESGRITGGKARSRHEANQIAEGLIRSGKAEKVEITPTMEPILNEIKLDLVGKFDGSLFQFCTKLAASLAVAYGYQSLISASDIPAYLYGTAAWPTKVAFCDITPLNQLKTPMAHTIYIEMGENSFGIVLLFGFKRVFVPLPCAASQKAVLASLDPISGEESFKEVEPIGFPDIPRVIDKRAAQAHLQNMLDILADDATSRGAKRRPELYVGDLDLGEQLPPWWGNSTVRYMFPNFPPR
jgi:hypothetical protein